HTLARDHVERRGAFINWHCGGSDRRIRRTAAARALDCATEERMSRSVVAAMTAYTLELREAEVKLNQNESPFDVPRELKERALALVAERPWNLYPDFESMTLREAIANAHGLASENILVGNGSNELLAATIATFVGPGTLVAIPKPTFALYEKLVTVAGGAVIPIDIDPSSGL